MMLLLGLALVATACAGPFTMKTARRLEGAELEKYMQDEKETPFVGSVLEWQAGENLKGSQLVLLLPPRIEIPPELRDAEEVRQWRWMMQLERKYQPQWYVRKASSGPFSKKSTRAPNRVRTFKRDEFHGFELTLAKQGKMESIYSDGQRAILKKPTPWWKKLI